MKQIEYTRMVFILATFWIIWGNQSSFCQELESNTVRILINNLPDTLPPIIKLITPNIEGDMTYYTESEELDLIGEVKDKSGVKFLSVNSDVRSINEVGIFSSRLKLHPGENRIRLVAVDNKDNIQGRSITIEYTPPVVTLADRINKEAKYYGLIIGINNYDDDELPDLLNPVKDAKKLYKVLIEKYNFHKENITIIENATRAQIIQRLDSLAEVITDDDNLLIFYAGHGSWNAESNNGFWLPSDADPFLKTNWFRNSTLADYLKEINSKHTLLITDACFAGSIFAMRSAFGNREKAYEKLYELPSRKAMTSGNLTEVPDRSSFTAYLIQRLEENEQTYLSSEQLFSSFRIAVINNSNAIPQYGEIRNVGDEGGDFIFLKKQ